MNLSLGHGNLRFPGQYYDSETGLHYNYFRDYDPSTGRYIQSDPIGLDDGVNTYAYVKNNPILLFDKEGLFDERIGGMDETQAWSTFVEPLFNAIVDACTSNYCKTISKDIAVTADVAAITAASSVVFTGGVTTPAAGFVGLTATIVAVGNGAVSLTICGKSKSHVTTAIAAILNGKKAAIVNGLDIVITLSND